MGSLLGGANGVMKYRLSSRLLSCLVVLACSGGCDPDSESAGMLETESSSAGSGPAGSCEAVVVADDFDRSCTQDADCVAVFEGASNEPCRECSNAAINTADQAAYDEALGPLSCADVGECLADCGPPQAECIANQCELEGWISCGDERCFRATQFCLRIPSDVENEPAESACLDLPADCEPGDCECLRAAAEPVVQDCLDEGSCTPIEETFRLSCAGG